MGCCFLVWWCSGDLHCAVGDLDLRFWVCFPSGLVGCRLLGCGLLCVGGLVLGCGGCFVYLLLVWVLGGFFWLIRDCVGLV